MFLFRMKFTGGLKILCSGAIVTFSHSVYSQSASNSRAPAVHSKTFSASEEPEYCKDLAANFCPMVASVVSFENRETRIKGDMLQALSDSKSEKDIAEFVNLFVKNLKNRGFDLKTQINVEDLNKVFTNLNGGFHVEIKPEDVLNLKNSSCEFSEGFSSKLVNEYLLEIKSASMRAFPSEESWSILRKSDSNDSNLYKNIRQRLQSSKAVHELLNAFGDFDPDDVESLEKFSKAHGDFVMESSQILVDQSFDAEKVFIENQSKLREFVLLCEVFSVQSESDDILESDCDLSKYSEVNYQKGIPLVDFGDFSVIDKKTIELKRKIWNTYKSNQKSNVGPKLVKFLNDMGAQRVVDESMFSRFISDQTNKPNFRESYKAQIAPLLNDQTKDQTLARLLCQERNELLSRALDSEVLRVKKLLETSQPRVHSLMNLMFSKEDSKSLNELFDNARERSRLYFDKISHHIDSKVEQVRFRRSFENLKIYDPRTKENIFKKDPYTDLVSIDFNKIPQEDFFYNLFLDGDFSFLTELNAFMPGDRHLSQFASNDGLVVLPALYKAYKDNPATLFWILGHETAHMLDPEVFKKMGSRFPPAWQSVLDCLSNKSSVSAKEHQHAECFADWFATELLADTVKDMPSQESRYQLVKDSMTMICELHMSGGSSVYQSPHSHFSIDEHPSPRKRINGILGVHPVVRSALGCLPSKKEPYCSMETRK